MSEATANPKLTRALRVAGIMLILGLVIEFVSLRFNHPLSFLGFMFIGGSLLALGILIYLWALVSISAAGRES